MKQKLCFIIPSLQPGGMERVMSELLWYFSKLEGKEIHLILYGINRDVFYTIPENIFIHRPTFNFNNSSRLISTFKTLTFLRKKTKEIKPHAVLSFGELWNNFVLLSLLGSKIPVFVSDRCQPDKSLGKFHNNLRKFLYPKAEGIIAQTIKAFEIYTKQFKPNKITIIGNPIRNIKTDNILKKEKIVLTVGRLIKTKHHDDLIKVFSRINKPDWKLVIVGDNALKQDNMTNLKQLVHDLGMDGKIELTGKSNEVEKYYLKSSIFAFTSSSEGFPNVIGEAMSSGLPIVAFDCIAGPSDMVKSNRNGFLVDLFDFDMFEKSLTQLMENENLRTEFGKNAEIDIKEFESDYICKKFHDFICQ
jgi:GalNAc-alpha-(1->4)-GalNAc-alpha-(1->3)-diNAcBac-PP-undecaprenol alpha-1,4-N-acetyl-D-galactosaminyltransferase